MQLLLDTHTFLWFAAGNPSLKRSARRRIEDVRNDKYLSVASIWEMAIKLSLGKLRLGVTLAEVIDIAAIGNGIHILPIALEHSLYVSTLPWHHRDPFDRMLIAQAIKEKMTILGSDSVFDAYQVRRLH
jgi:PIN domain nuclease of toxin-antitoxin system